MPRGQESASASALFRNRVSTWKVLQRNVRRMSRQASYLVGSQLCYFGAVRIDKVSRHVKAYQLKLSSALGGTMSRTEYPIASIKENIQH